MRSINGLVLKVFDIVLFGTACLSALQLLVVRGFMVTEPPFLAAFFHGVYLFLAVLFLAWVARKLVVSGWNLRGVIHDIILAVVLMSMVVPLQISAMIVSYRLVFALVARLVMVSGLPALFDQIKLNPARILLLSFVLVITVGTALLMLPVSTADGLGTRFVDAIFTATSATCVTGLIVQDTGSYFSPFGQLVILLMIQIGGLGFMTLSTLFIMMVGRRLGFKREQQMRDLLEITSSSQMYKLMLGIVGITAIFESAGFVLLFMRWVFVMPPFTALKHAVFHSISAFCNAGFSLNTTSLEAYSGDVYVNAVVMVLIVTGGLGFVVLTDLVRNMHGPNPLSIDWSRLNVHTKIVLVTSFFLIITGTMTVFFFEFDNTMLDMSIPGKLTAALFQSITYRTAGFNTIPTDHLRDVTLFTGMIFMFIGASPSSTGGGIKTTTFAVLVLTVRSLMISREKIEISRRTVPMQTVNKSFAILFFSLTFLLVITAMLLASQDGRFIDILFEAVSAIGTVGLSTGTTSSLNTTGKLLIVVLMYTGRVGPLTVALALREARKVNISYPSTRIMVG